MIFLQVNNELVFGMFSQTQLTVLVLCGVGVFATYQLMKKMDLA